MIVIISQKDTFVLEETGLRSFSCYLRTLRDVFPVFPDDLPGYSRILLIATYVVQFLTQSSNMSLKSFYDYPFSRYVASKFENV